MMHLSLRRSEILYAQLAAMERAGIPIVDALHTLAERPGDPVAGAASQLRARILAGDALHEAMNALGPAFSDYERGLVRASERSGKLEASFAALECHFAEKRRRRSQLFLGLLYPFVVINAAIFILAIPTWFQAGLLGFLAAVAWPAGLLYGSIAALLLWMRLAAVAPPLRALTHHVLLALPVLGPTFRDACAARFFLTLAALLDAAVSVLEALPTAANSSGSLVLAERWARAATEPSTAARLSERIGRLGILDPAVLALISTGEVSGQTVGSLRRVAALLESRVQMRVRAALILVPVIALRVIGFWTGYFERVTTID